MNAKSAEFVKTSKELIYLAKWAEAEKYIQAHDFDHFSYTDLTVWNFAGMDIYYLSAIFQGSGPIANEKRSLIYQIRK